MGHDKDRTVTLQNRPSACRPPALSAAQLFLKWGTSTYSSDIASEKQEPIGLHAVCEELHPGSAAD
jgi:hypothetical protein